MVQEVRSILFTAEEGHVAVTILLMTRVRGLQPDQVRNVDLGDRARSAAVTLRGKQGVETLMALTSDDLMRALLLYCRRAKIPLSSRSEKRLSLVSGCLALTMSINLRPAAPVVSGDTVKHVLNGPDLALMHRV